VTTVASATAATFCATLTDEWWRCGVRDAVVCPGSRSTPLALALLRQNGIRLSVRLDERGAGYFAIGLALATGDPVVVLTTSGTAAAELHAAVLEAHHARVPLIICTADRPPELRDVGAPQTIEQARLYGHAVRWFADPGVPAPAMRDSWRSLASRLVAESSRGPHGPGPVHVNLPFREPLVGVPEQLPPPRDASAGWHSVTVPTLGRSALEQVGCLLRPEKRGVVVLGAAPKGSVGAATDLARTLGWPLLADPRSGARAIHPNVVGAADTLLRDEVTATTLLPDVVVRVGEPWASKVLASWLSRSASTGAIHVSFDPDWAWRDAGREIAHVIRAPLSGEMVESVAPNAGPDSTWLQAWTRAEAIAQVAIDSVLSRHPEATEPGVARDLYAFVPETATVFTSSSMPVRDLEWFARPREAPPRVLANRGVNGIDGVVSTILGVAASGPRGAPAPVPVYGLVGDLAVLHDASALVRPKRGAPATPAVIVVLDNDGGGIFSFLPQAGSLDENEFEQIFATPQEPAVADLVRGCGYSVSEITEAAEFAPSLASASAEASASGRPVFIIVDTNRQANVAVHGEIEQAVSNGLRSWDAGTTPPG
jgi:2-succinyl-5-enolpyruvyl-6-hydroxy-3-cyclohexene-1-carboxylate synthase